MFFLSLFMDLLMLLNLGGLTQSVDFAQVGHATHGHLAGPVDPHFVGLADHLHHGQHGHSAGPSGGEHYH